MSADRGGGERDGRAHPSPLMPASNAARSTPNGPAAARPAAPGTACRGDCRATAPPKGLGQGAGGGRALGFVGLTGPSMLPPRRTHRHRRVRPRLRRRAGAGLGDPGRRRSRHRQIDPAAAGRRRDRRSRAARRVPPTSPARRRSTRSGCAPSGSASPTARCCSPPPAACATSSPRSTRDDAPRSGRHRFDPDDVSRHARQRAGHGQPGARRGAGADRGSPSGAALCWCWSATSPRKG